MPVRRTSTGMQVRVRWREHGGGGAAAHPGGGPAGAGRGGIGPV